MADEIIAGLKSGGLHLKRDGFVTIDGSSKLERLFSDFPEVPQMLEEIKRCVYSPGDSALTNAGRTLFDILGSSVPDKDELILRDTDERLKAAFDKHEEMIEVRSDEVARGYAELAELTDRFKHESNRLVHEQDRLKLRDAMSLVDDLRDAMAATTTAINNGEQAVINHTAERDAADKSRKDSYDRLMLTMTDRSSFLFLLMGEDSSISTPLSDRIMKLSKDDIQLFRSELTSRVKGFLSTLNGEQNVNSPNQIGLLSKTGTSALVGGSTASDFANYLSSKEAVVIQSLFEYGKKTEAFRKGKSDPDTLNYLDRSYRLTDGSITVTANQLQHEIHRLNVIALAGYNPTRWAEAFGLPISGIAKQILSAWSLGRTGPLSANNIRNIFNGKTDFSSFELDYTTLSQKLTIDDRRETIKASDDLFDRKDALADIMLNAPTSELEK